MRPVSISGVDSESGKRHGEGQYNTWLCIVIIIVIISIIIVIIIIIIIIIIVIIIIITVIIIIIITVIIVITVIVIIFVTVCTGWRGGPYGAGHRRRSCGKTRYHPVIATSNQDLVVTSL